ncbi:cupin domain-containing protein [Sneathiella marina]|uniref:Cupin domain-containing protein n=1 Tax=Sneathiella marina TaxID=2950108 RepID=A0ABY4W6I7_9PROT|nr:cupin domain-containing protein [Sneathiella marina]USG62544.1 cupin domain-containing protein [Sneathiella marina]
MELNADFNKRVVMHADEIDWLSSPIPGVDRRMLDRIGGEVARATTIVRYAPNSKFSPHIHTGGEEFIVLEGVFQDEHGDFPAGSYIRNPPTSGHTPGSDKGCVIFVKLWQFDLKDRTPVKIDMNKMGSIRDADRAGVSVMPLFMDERETVRMETWDANAGIGLDLPDGGEFLVLDGEFTETGDQLRSHSWLRIPMGGRLDAKVGHDGAKVWVKSRHLRFADAPISF